MTTGERLIALERRATQHDKEVGGIRKLITIGMKMLNRNQDQIHLLTGEVRALAAAQRRTEASLQRTEAALRGLIESRRAGNGHTKRKVDLQ
jgi:uncharacterized coiled-coil protein SlyX